MSQDPSSAAPSHHGGQLVYEVIDGVDHQLDVVLVGHAVLAVPAEDDVHVGAEDPLGDLHGDVPGHVFVFEPVNKPHGAGDGDGAVEDTVIFCLSQEVHAELVMTLLCVFGGDQPFPLFLEFLTRLLKKKQKRQTHLGIDLKKLKISYMQYMLVLLLPPKGES